MSEKVFQLSGKDYFTREEAAHYACWSPRHWDSMKVIYGFQAIPWGGKTVYRRDDIQRAMESAACQQSNNEGKPGSFAGRDQTEARTARRKSTVRH